MFRLFHSKLHSNSLRVFNKGLLTHNATGAVFSHPTGLNKSLATNVASILFPNYNVIWSYWMKKEKMDAIYHTHLHAKIPSLNGHIFSLVSMMG